MRRLGTLCEALRDRKGMAATLGSLMPVFIIPVVYVLYRQKTSWRGVLGAVIAITGVAILMLL